MSLSTDGNTAIWGAPDDNSLVGAVWEFTREGGQWTQMGTKLTGTGEAALGSIGSSVALSADGTTVAAGTFPDTHETGGVWMFGSAAAPGPSISSGGVVNGASFLSGIAPGSWITIQGTNLSATNRTWTNSDFVGNNLPTQLDGVRVTVDGLPAYVYFVSPTQLNVLSPADTSQGTVPVQVSNGQGTSNLVSANLAAVSPGLVPLPLSLVMGAAVRRRGALGRHIHGSFHSVPRLLHAHQAWRHDPFIRDRFRSYLTSRYHRSDYEYRPIARPADSANRRYGSDGSIWRYREPRTLPVQRGCPESAGWRSACVRRNRWDLIPAECVLERAGLTSTVVSSR